MPKRLLSVLCICGIAAYPFFIYLGVSFNLLSILLPALAVIFLLRLFYLRETQGIKTLLAAVSALCAAVICIIAFMADSERIAMFYPVCVNAILFFIFGGSLFSSKTIITRLALLYDKDLPDYAIEYTRTVTKVWVLFFMANGGMAFITAMFCTVETWTLYNGFIAYILIGTLAGCEYLARIIVRRIHEK
ncbi:Uncharacterized membrane protein [Succinivibrio dextrinosolvens]|uniref:COG4648 family protein n=1 Tax=Succinivibrio dextrinosolvens TaxID=83771 RepID=UPI0008E2B93B|nr:hypothetical protein [Succinivibrio dextrinosolvens]SFS75496.1 Uncharacterized membrane protein [Succinivibrio dextrinosolvens]